MILVYFDDSALWSWSLLLASTRDVDYVLMHVCLEGSISLNLGWTSFILGYRSWGVRRVGRKVPSHRVATDENKPFVFLHWRDL